MGDGQFKPGVAAIIIIAIGILILILLFIFAKRQIMRLAQKFPTDGPHAPIGYAAPKELCHKIERHLNNIRSIHFEPILLNPDNHYCSEANATKYKHIYRMKTVDDLKDLEKFIIASYGLDDSKCRHPNQDLRQYLLDLQRENGPMSHCDPILINELVDIYLHARFDPEPDFNAEHYHRYRTIMERLKQQIIPKTISQRSSPTKVVQRKILHKGLTTNLSFKNLANLSSSSSSSMAKDNNGGGGNKKTDETSV
ncbi:hypothetical protein BLA29_006931 [Euroglyphus maynei]|uniref:Uncharacterized protein n=1 Tax=Euroglyphus maynei TaxID=6958 RepID=A0A1Y3BFK7_EURMA|nr:hypothetical protein BLA29_006931 [Euroglyphus maynei]